MLSPAQIEAAGCFNSLAVQALLKKQDRFGSLGEVDEMALAGILSTQLVHHHFIGQPKPSYHAAPTKQKIIMRGQLSPVNRIGVL